MVLGAAWLAGPGGTRLCKPRELQLRRRSLSGCLGAQPTSSRARVDSCLSTDQPSEVWWFRGVPKGLWAQGWRQHWGGTEGFLVGFQPGYQGH